MPQIKLMNEYGAAFPLWIDGFYEGPEPFSHLSEELHARLRQWADGFDRNYSPFDGWRSDGLKQEHVREALALFAALKAELGPDADVILDLWEAPEATRSVEDVIRRILPGGSAHEIKLAWCVGILAVAFIAAMAIYRRKAR